MEQQKTFTITMTEQQLGTLGGLLDMAAKAGGLRVSKDVVAVLSILEGATDSSVALEPKETKADDEAGND